MSIEQVTAYKTSDGRCFASLDEARKEELMRLLTALATLPARKPKAPAPAELDRTIGEVESWLTQARALQAQMKPAGS